MATRRLVCSPSQRALSLAAINNGLAMKQLPAQWQWLGYQWIHHGPSIPIPSYKSYMVGNGISKRRRRHPTARGFDTFYGLREAAGAIFGKGKLLQERSRDGKHIKLKGFSLTGWRCGNRDDQSDKKFFFLFLPIRLLTLHFKRPQMIWQKPTAMPITPHSKHGW